MVLEELTNITDTIQLLIQGVKLFEEFEVTKPVVSMNSLHGNAVVARVAFGNNFKKRI